VEVRLAKEDVVMQRRKTNVRAWTRIAPGVAPVEVMRSQLGRKVRPHNKVGWDVKLMARNLLPGERASLEAIKARLEARIETLETDLDGSKVRSAVRETLEGPLQALPVRAAVYFVPARHGERLMELREVFDVLDGSYCDVFPLVRDERTTVRMRELLIERTRVDVDDLLSALGPHLARHAVSEHVHGKAKAAAQSIIARSWAYVAEMRLEDEAVDALMGQHERLSVGLDALGACRTQQAG